MVTAAPGAMVAQNGDNIHKKPCGRMMSASEVLLPACPSDLQDSCATGYAPNRPQPAMFGTTFTHIDFFY